MARTTGVVLATGAVTVVNSSIFHGQPIDWRIPIASGLAAIGFSLLERIFGEAAVAMAWTGFAVVMLTRINPNVPSPTESLIDWWQKGQTK